MQEYSISVGGSPSPRILVLKNRTKSKHMSPWVNTQLDFSLHFCLGLHSPRSSQTPLCPTLRSPIVKSTTLILLHWPLPLPSELLWGLWLTNGDQERSWQPHCFLESSRLDLLALLTVQRLFMPCDFSLGSWVHVLCPVRRGPLPFSTKIVWVLPMLWWGDGVGHILSFEHGLINTLLGNMG